MKLQLYSKSVIHKMAARSTDFNTTESFIPARKKQLLKLDDDLQKKHRHNKILIM